jgi:arylsulfatase A-like enzyme
MMGFVLFCAVGIWGAATNVVLLSVDTLRADYLGCYGYPRNTSPGLDQFAKEGLLFEDCVCEVPLTNPSFGAMLSSLYPRMTGTTKNGLKMPESVPLATELFKTAGYQTWCVQSNWTLKGKLCRLDRGFDVYRDDFTKRRWGFMSGERDAQDVTDTALEVLKTRDPDQPFFFWVHYSDPHAPYKFHKAFNPWGRRPLPLNMHERVRAKYASEVAYTDYHIARFLRELPRDNTVVAFVADHGESLYEHNYLGHGRRIYRTNLHVPLIIRGPGITPGRTSRPACVLDMAPTLLALAGLAPAPAMLGRNLLDLGPSAVSTRFVETYGGAVPRLPGVKAWLADRGPMRRGVIHEGWKLIRGGDGPELYYLPDDPKEECNLASRLRDRVEELTDLIKTWNEQCPRGHARRANLDEEDVQALKSLGYLE